MRHFLFEFITSGGMSRVDLPIALQAQGNQMISALLNDLIAAGETSFLICRDYRLPKLHPQLPHYFVRNDTKQLFAELDHNDLVWLIAPETDGILAGLVTQFSRYDGQLMMSSISDIEISSSKMCCYHWLRQHDIATVDTYWLRESYPDSDTGWVVKPDDGAGAEHCMRVKSKIKLRQMQNAVNNDNIIVQPFLEGKSLSLSMLCLNGQISLLACNQQQIVIHDDGRISLSKIDVNACPDDYETIAQLARAIAAILTGLRGYVGIDLIKQNNQFNVLDINPRLTTSYAGVSESLGVNVAALMCNMIQKKCLPQIDIYQAKSVTIDL